jgi:dephospho-CoA kinase
MNSSIKTAPAIIAITGTIGSGKSTFSKMLQELGCIVISADSLARQVVLPGSEGLASIKRHFGDECIAPDGSLDRKKLASLVFTNPDKKASLESILHPKIRDLFNQESERAWNTAMATSPVPYLFYDIPLYFETNYQHPWIKKVVTVAASPARCIERIIQRDNLSHEAATTRLGQQLSISEKVKRSDFVIENETDDLVALRGQAEQFIKNLT